MKGTPASRRRSRLTGRIARLLGASITAVAIMPWGPAGAGTVPSPTGIRGLLFTGQDSGAASVDAQAADHTVVMGAVDPGLPDATPRPPASAGRLDRFEYTAYYPNRLRVHRGDTVLFRRDGFHTVTFVPEGQPAPGFLRRDETEGVSGLDSMEPSDPTCGGSGQPACVLSGTDQFVNSGWADLRLTVDLPEGTYSYVCMLHGGMKGEIQVAPEDKEVATPEEVEAERQLQVARDTASAEAVLEANQTPQFEPVGDHVRWFVKAGDNTADDRVAILRFMPANLEIGPDDEVEFLVPGDDVPAAGATEVMTELHTATFPNDPTTQFGMLRYVNPACETDEPASGRPGIPATLGVLVTGCPADTSLEFLFQPTAWRTPLRAPGDLVLSPATVHDSGLLTRKGAPCRIGCDPWTGEALPSSFPAKFPAEGTFGYACLVHPEWGMAGSIRVAG